MACIMCHHLRFMLSLYYCPAEEGEESTGMAHKAEHAD